MGAGMGLLRVRMFVMEPQPERVAGVLRPVVPGDRRGEIVVIEERRTLSQQGKVVLRELAQHRLDFRSVGSVGAITDVAKSDVEEEGSLGAFIGINWPITRDLSFDLEAVMRSDLSIGAALYYAF